MGWDAFLGALAPSLVTLVFAVAAYLRARAAQAAGVENGAKLDHNTALTAKTASAVEVVSTAVNGKLAELLAAARAAAHAEGVTEGSERERRRQAVAGGTTLDPPGKIKETE